MKITQALCGAAIIAAILFTGTLIQAQVEYQRTPFTDALPSGSTNTIVVDTRNTSGVGLQVALTGSGANTTTAVIGVTNASDAAFPQTFTVLLGAVTNVYSWTNAPVLSNTIYSKPYTNLLLGITNAGNLAGATLTIVVNATTNTFNWTNAATAPTDILTDADAGTAVTNEWRALSGIYPLVSINDSVITLRARVGDTVSVSKTPATWGTNNLVGIYSVTNLVATNAMQLMTTNDTGWAATNLFRRLAADFPTVTVTQPSPAMIEMVTKANPGLSVSSSGAWATNSLTTNAILGNIYFKGSNTLDRVTWFRNASRDFQLAFSGTSQVTTSTNWTDVWGAGWWSWSVENAATNYGDANAILIQAATKRGL